MKNLYVVNFTHYAQRGSESGIKEYLIAENNEQVMDYLVCDAGYTCWEDWDEEDLKAILSCQDESVLGNLSDLYYGQSQISWELVFENILQSEICTLCNLKIVKELN